MRMIYKEEICNILELDDSGWYKVHCISADLAMGKGLAKAMNEKYDLRKKILEKYEHEEREFPDCILVDNIFNLVTKVQYDQKPQYSTMICAMQKLDRMIVEGSVRNIAMPLIGCGLDSLEWKMIKKLIFRIFDYTECTILVCRDPNTTAPKHLKRERLIEEGLEYIKKGI